MKELNEMLDCMKKRAEETFEFYANKDKWEPQDLKCAKDAAELYDKLQTIQMNTGIWENMKRDSDYSFARYPHISYGHDGQRMSRESHWDGGFHGDSYGRHHSYGDEMRHDGGYSTHSVKDQAIQRLEQLMDTAKSDYERQEIHRMIETIENQKR